MRSIFNIARTKILFSKNTDTSNSTCNVGGIDAFGSTCGADNAERAKQVEAPIGTEACDSFETASTSVISNSPKSNSSISFSSFCHSSDSICHHQELLSDLIASETLEDTCEGVETVEVASIEGDQKPRSYSLSTSQPQDNRTHSDVHHDQPNHQNRFLRDQNFNSLHQQSREDRTYVPNNDKNSDYLNRSPSSQYLQHKSSLSPCPALRKSKLWSTPEHRSMSFPQLEDETNQGCNPGLPLSPPLPLMPVLTTSEEVKQNLHTSFQNLTHTIFEPNIDRSFFDTCPLSDKGSVLGDHHHSCNLENIDVNPTETTKQEMFANSPTDHVSMEVGDSTCFLSDLSVSSSADTITSYEAQTNQRKKNHFLATDMHSHHMSRSISSADESSKESNCKKSSSSYLSYRNASSRNYFQTLPRHLIRNGLIQQATCMLKDERFIIKRIENLGAVLAAKMLVRDCKCLRRRDVANNCDNAKSGIDYMRKIGKEGKVNNEEVEVAILLPSSPSSGCSKKHKSLKSFPICFPNEEDYISTTLESFDLFMRCIMKMNQIRMINVTRMGISRSDSDSADASLYQSRRVRDENDASNDDDVKLNALCAISSESKKGRNEDGGQPEIQIPFRKGGEALYILGKSLHDREWDDDAMIFYRHAFHLFFSSELDIFLPNLLDESQNDIGLAYTKAASIAVVKNTCAHEKIASMLTRMGDIHGKNGEINSAMEAYQAAQTLYAKNIADNKYGIDKGCGGEMPSIRCRVGLNMAMEGIALTYNRIGGVYCSQGNLLSAMESFQKALKIQQRALGANHVEVGKTLHNIGVIHRHSGKLDGAIRFYIKAHQIFESNLGKTNLDTARTLHNIGGVHRRRKEYDKALKCFREVLRVRKTLLGNHHPSVSLTQVSIAAVLRRSGLKEEAKKYYSEAMK